MKKRAQMHVEMIISFVLFIGVLLIVFLFINPFSKTSEKTNTREIEQAIYNNISVNIGKLTIVLNQSSDCYQVPTEYGNRFIEIVNPEENKVFNLYFSDIFDVKTITCSSPKYSLGSYSIENTVIYEKIQELVASYSDYSNLKNNLKIKDDFVFSFRQLDGTEISDLSVSKNYPSNVEVISEDYPLVVMNKLGEKKELILNIKKW